MTSMLTSAQYPSSAAAWAAIDDNVDHDLARRP
jgi:hypothetical protein